MPAPFDPKSSSRDSRPDDISFQGHVSEDTIFLGKVGSTFEKVTSSKGISAAIDSSQYLVRSLSMH